MSACSDDEELLADARALLAEEDGATSADLTSDVGAILDEAASHAIGDTGRHPARIGPYKVVRPLGRGGMGVVYLARQESPLKRDVAIKVVRHGLTDDDTLARFRAERQALALMEHANIARVFDAGATEDGLPYFVMELVEGLPITEFCDTNRLGLEARLGLFGMVCQAVHHAHQRGVIHRDLKPSNVLVVMADGNPTPKVIDFGIAKGTDALLSDQTIHTRIGSFIGTVDYMSPEQLAGAPEGVDTRADVYALGVILYELVSGRHPFAGTTLRRAGLLEAQKIIIETDPPRPSWSVGEAERGEERARDRSSDQRTLRRRVREDLDWVVMKALEKDRDRRYQSALGLATDLERYARHEPVNAGPPNLSYRARKFIRRHRVGVTAAALVTLALLSGAGLAVTGLLRATAEARRSQAISSFLTDMLASVQPDQEGRSVTVAEILDASRARLEGGDFADDRETDASLALVIGHSYEALGRFDEALDLYERSAALRRGGDEERLHASLYRLGTVLWKRGDLEEALALRLQLAEMTESMYGMGHAAHAESLSNLANTHADMGNFAPAEEYLRAAVEVGRRLPGEEGELDLARFLNNLGTVMVDLERFADAVELFEEVLEIRGRIVGPEQYEYAITLVNLGNAQLGAGDLEAAESTLRRAVVLEEKIFGEMHPRTAFAYSGLGSVLMNQDRHAEAEPYVRRALAIRVATSGPNAWRVSMDRRKLAEIMMATGRASEALSELDAAWAGLVATGSDSTSRGRDVASSLARLHGLLGDDESAATWAARAGS